MYFIEIDCERQIARLRKHKNGGTNCRIMTNVSIQRKIMCKIAFDLGQL